MIDFLVNCLFWICALYGFIEIIKNIIYIHSCSRINTDGINMIVAVKNQEDKIEGFLRSLNFRILYGKEDSIENVIVLDLDSTDNTKDIVSSLSTEYTNVKVLSWNEFEELFNPRK
ncbi:MAG: glycosyltransferase [Clostridia bacterium]|nr:glycosyltransferase [Clostridia bacterium]